MQSFQLVNVHAIPALHARLEQYVEPMTGARHIHLASDQQEMAFLVGFPTVPQASDGRAHILEHLTLCGSEKYPVADPFFAMMRRSTATFMNAMTYADRTIYPFASTDVTDFFNLLDVYLDATFFPKLDYLSFRQEGWRHVLKEGRLRYQGVVFNEMKGAFDNPMRALYRGITANLLPATTYQYDSGGDPLIIPDLTHEMLVEFHATHYSPSQAMFMTAGRVDAAAIQSRIVDRVLSRRQERLAPRMPELATPWTQPREAEIRIPSQEASDNEFGMQLAWRFGESSDAMAAARLQLLERGLLGDASAPVLKAMQCAGFGRPSSLNGLDDGTRHLILHLGMEGLTAQQMKAAQTVVLEALQAAAVGVPEEVLHAALRDMRFSQRQIVGGSTPDGLARLIRAVPALMNGGDVASAFDNEQILGRLEQEIAEPAFFSNMVNALLEHPTRLLARVIPDADYAAKRERVELDRLAMQEVTLTEQDRQRILAEEDALSMYRLEGSDYSALPCIRPGDVGIEPSPLPAIRELAPQVRLFEAATNGICYATLVRDLGSIAPDDWQWLAVYADVVEDLGVGTRSYEEASRWRKQQVPTFSVALDALQPTGKSSVMPQLKMHVAILEEEQAHAVAVLQAWMSPRFDELDRIGFLVKSQAERTLNDLADSGGFYAQLSAAAPCSPRRAFSHLTRGLPSLPFTASLRKMSGSPEGREEIARQLERLHALISACPTRLIWTGVGDLASAASPSLALDAGPPPNMAPTQALQGGPAANAALRVASQVNHCHIAWPAPRLGQPDAAALAVAAELLTHRSLHRRLREEGGAYGGSAAYSGEDGLFTMNSYRDPRVAGTYADFALSLEDLVNTEYDVSAMDEAIISVIKRLDKPLPPRDSALIADRLDQLGIHTPLRREHRQQVLCCTLAQVRDAASRWLSIERSSRAASVTQADQPLDGMAVVEVASLAR
ncbi:insulinase family protein [Roseateles cellulosilyticus]|uniref:Insulinase family protein n=1 Tax=Pelomonas cellulosilytica TaxID=2906762 RepID=A0ABS8Y3X2_9BURK|nr:insulinase family protein [Pelomonas sp. P8]MCE4557941.1 insulinase family protein [Pelomonas sp. P8]